MALPPRVLLFSLCFFSRCSSGIELLVELPYSLDLAVAVDGESSRGSRVSRRRRLGVLIGAALGFGLANCTRTAWILGVRAADAWRGSEGVPG
jgi:hypothetical protein